MKQITVQIFRLAMHLSATRLLGAGALGLLITCGVFHSAGAQAVYGSIIGTVTDNAGAVIPNATVKITDVAKGTSISVQTNGSGEYTAQPRSLKIASQFYSTATSGGTLAYQNAAPNNQVAADPTHHDLSRQTEEEGAVLLKNDNFLPLGQAPGAVSSSGTIALISFFVGIEVAAAFVLMIGELLEQTLLVRTGGR